MPKLVRIDEDERWPDYFLSEIEEGDNVSFGVTCSEEFYRRFKRISNEYDQLQGEIRKAVRDRQPLPDR